LARGVVLAWTVGLAGVAGLEALRLRAILAVGLIGPAVRSGAFPSRRLSTRTRLKTTLRPRFGLLPRSGFALLAAVVTATVGRAAIEPRTRAACTEFPR
jgi:hypothetical protein